MSQFHRKQPSKYTDGRTKQAFKDDTDINKILSRASKAGTMSHLEKNEGFYADFSDFDFFENQLMLTRGSEIFDSLPAELKREFQQSPRQFFAFVNDPANAGKLDKLLPELAEPGDIRLDASNRTPPETRANPSGDEQPNPPATLAAPNANAPTAPTAPPAAQPPAEPVPST